MDGTSLDIQQTQLEKLKELFPEVISEGKVDWERLKATLGDDVNFSNERYVLNWAGKSDAFRLLQQPTTATLKPAKDESINFDETGHVFIEGENLEVLKVLQKSYYGKVKMIYIDPPYNTGNDHFIYPDRFSETKEEYLKRTGEKDEEGYMTREGMYRKNSRDSGHYHSNWLNMMYPRLFLARNLLRDDGVIFISIDDNEVHNLRLLMNEIFGEENFVGQLIWKSRQNKDNRNITGLSVDHEYVLCYLKNNSVRALKGTERKTDLYSNPDKDPRGPWVSGNMVGLLPKDQRPNCHYDLVNPQTGINYGKPKMGWRYDKNTMNKLIDENRILWPSENSGRPRRKVFLKELNNQLPNYTSIIGKNIFTRDGTKEIVDLFGDKYFDFPKPAKLLSELIDQTTEPDNNDLVFDFFSGSGSLAHGVLLQNFQDDGNRRFICAQLPEKTDPKSEAFKADYKTIADIAKERIRRVIKKFEAEEEAKKKEKAGQLDFGDEKEKPEPDLGFKVFKLQPSNFKIWRGSTFENGQQLDKQLEAFTDPVKEGSAEENMLYELLLKSGYDLNSRIEQKSNFFVINENEMVVALSKISEEIVKNILALKPGKCIALDKLFTGNDQLKTNTVLQMRDGGVEFRTI